MTSKKKSGRQPTKPSAPRSGGASGSGASEHYHREKARRAHKAPPESEAMAAARREYLALLEAGATAGKRGRPKKTAAKPAAPSDDDLDELGDEPEVPPDADEEVE